jgi:hypothetical protein
MEGVHELFVAYIHREYGLMGLLALLLTCGSILGEKKTGLAYHFIPFQFTSWLAAE